jgi:hypothetical protein
VIVYKIRSKNDPSKFLTGTPTYNNWNKSGRIFPTIGKLRAFLNSSLGDSGGRRPRVNNTGDWDIVEYELTELSTKDVHEMIKPEQLIKMLTK